MLSALAATEPKVSETFREASQILGWDVAKLVEEGPIEELNRTERTQPALLAASIAVYRSWRAQEGAMPSLLAGHSLGEYTALVVAGALSFADALRLVQLRGQLMQQAVPAGTGGMAAVIGLEDAGVEAACAAYSGAGVLEPVNYNAPGQVVVAGTTDALDWLLTHGREHGAKKVMRLPVSVPSHCSLMKPAADRLAAHLIGVQFEAPKIPVLHNLDAAPRSDVNGIRQALVEQLYKPVRWTQSVRAMADQGVNIFIECGPGKVLTGLNKRILADGVATSFAGEDPASLRAALQAFTPMEKIV
jgi:[acyl-carrier-protein] S-malonyltransferase